MTERKLPPHNIDAEEQVIGSLLLGADMTMLTLKPSDFYHERDSWLFEACQSLNSRRVPIDEITLSQELEQRGKLEACGGSAYLSHIVSLCPTSLDCEYYADIVKRLSVYRQMIKAAEQISRIGYEQEPDVAQSLSKAEELLVNLRKTGISSPVISPSERVAIAGKHYEALYNASGRVCLPSGLTDLDNFIGGGFFPSEMIVIGARPGMGKTSLLMTIANHLATEHCVLVCSAEMNIESITDRDIAGILGRSTHTIRRGDYDQDLFDKIVVDGLRILSSRKIHFYHDTPLTTAKILQAGMNLKLKESLGIIIVDYLGLLDDDYGSSQYERVGYVSRKLKQVAMKLDVPIVVAHQLNRELERRDDKRPHLSDLRDSGRVEEDADLVLFLYRDSYYQDVKSDIAEIGVEKQRQGEVGVVRVSYDRLHQKYVDFVGG